MVNRKLDVRQEVLFISYFFPPLSGPGVQRSYNFVKNLPEQGWTPIVLAVKEICYVGKDEELLKRLGDTTIYRTEALDPMRLLHIWENFRRVKKAKSLYFQSGKGIRNIMRNIIPVDSKSGWLPWALAAGKRICRLHDIKVIFASMSPYSSGLLAYKLSQRTGIPYVLDYRDLWLGKPDMSYLTAWHKKTAIRWEKKIAESASAIIHVTERSADYYQKLFPEVAKDKIKVIFNGYDRDILPAINPESVRDTQKLKFCYAGHFYGGQHPGNFLRALREMENSGDLPAGLQVEFTGNYSREIEELFRGINCVRRIDYLNYLDYLNKLIDSDVLILFISNEHSEMILTQKLFEYLAVRRPILALVPPAGEAAELISRYRAGVIVDGTDIKGIKEAVKQLARVIKEDRIDEEFEISRNDYSRFERQSQAGELAEIFNKVTDG